MLANKMLFAAAIFPLYLLAVTGAPPWVAVLMGLFWMSLWLLARWQSNKRNMRRDVGGSET